MSLTIEKLLTGCLKDCGKAHLPLKKIVMALPLNIRKELKINSSTTVGSLQAILNPLLGNQLKIFRKRTVYLGLNQSSTDFILNVLDRDKGNSFKQLNRNLPFTIGELTASLNQLLEGGKIYTILRKTDQLPLFLNRLCADKKMDVSLEKNERQDFHNAYQEIGKGHGFVRLYQLKAYLEWSEKKFKNVLRELMSHYDIELHPGDPTSLNEKQLKNSFIDTDGELYLTVSWRGEIP